MTRSIKSNAIFAAALPVLLMGFASSAHAQYQVGSNGHALDANNRVGSGGYNGNAIPHNSSSAINNNIVTGNVTGLNYFHGLRTGEFDQSTFSGDTGSSSFSRFNAISAPSDVSARATGVPTYNPYYNQGNLVGPPPANFVTTPGATGYTPAPYVSPLTPTRYDSRIDVPNVDPTKGNLLTPGELNIGGPVDPSTGDQSMYSMSPLYGVRQNDQGLVNGQESIFNYRSKGSDAANRALMTPGQIQQMRDELNKTVIQNGATDQELKPGQSSQSVQPGQINQSGQSQNQNQNQNQTPGQIPAAGDLTGSQAINSAPLKTNNLDSAQPLNTAVPTAAVTPTLSNNDGVQNQLMVAPAKQSRQLAELEKKFAADKQSLTAQQSTDLYNEEVRLNKQAQQKAAAQQANKTNPAGTDQTRGTGTALTAKPDAVETHTAKPILTKPDTAVEPAQPYIVTSLSSGISAKGLQQLMKTAEDQMRQGKFTESVDTYDSAEQVAPNNPFVTLGRSFAEIGASYYGKADLDLNRAIALDPAVMAGRYDLKGFLGEDRVKFVQGDLQDIADSEKGARPLVLLGFIAHNGGDDTLAAKDLNEAAKRGGYANLVAQLKQAWGLK